MIKKLATILLGFLFATSASAQMIRIGEGAEGLVVTYNPKTGVSDYDEYGYLTIGFVVQHQQYGRVSVFRESVRIADCKKGMGYSYVRNMDNYFVFKSNWVYGGNSIASSKATLFCDIAKNQNIY